MKRRSSPATKTSDCVRVKSGLRSSFAGDNIDYNKHNRNNNNKTTDVRELDSKRRRENVTCGLVGEDRRLPRGGEHRGCRLIAETTSAEDEMCITVATPTWHRVRHWSAPERVKPAMLGEDEDKEAGPGISWEVPLSLEQEFEALGSFQHIGRGNQEDGGGAAEDDNETDELMFASLLRRVASERLIRTTATIPLLQTWARRRAERRMRLEAAAAAAATAAQKSHNLPDSYCCSVCSSSYSTATSEVPEPTTTHTDLIRGPQRLEENNASLPDHYRQPRYVGGGRRGSDPCRPTFQRRWLPAEPSDGVASKLCSYSFSKLLPGRPADSCSTNGTESAAAGAACNQIPDSPRLLQYPSSACSSSFSVTSGSRNSGVEMYDPGSSSRSSKSLLPDSSTFDFPGDPTRKRRICLPCCNATPTGKVPWPRPRVDSLDDLCRTGETATTTSTTTSSSYNCNMFTRINPDTVVAEKAVTTTLLPKQSSSVALGSDPDAAGLTGPAATPSNETTTSPLPSRSSSTSTSAAASDTTTTKSAETGSDKSSCPSIRSGRDLRDGEDGLDPRWRYPGLESATAAAAAASTNFGNQERVKTKKRSRIKKKKKAGIVPRGATGRKRGGSWTKDLAETLPRMLTILFAICSFLILPTQGKSK